MKNAIPNALCRAGGIYAGNDRVREQVIREEYVRRRGAGANPHKETLYKSRFVIPAHAGQKRKAR